MLAAHVGQGSNTFLIVKDQNEVFVTHYPYSYDPINFSHSFSPQKFYEDLFSRIAQENGIDLSKTKTLLVSSLPEEYFSGLNAAAFCPSKELDMASDDYGVVYIKRYVDPEIIGSTISDSRSETSIDILSNMGLYDNLVPSSLEDNVVWGRDVLYSHYYPPNLKENEKKVLFTGPALIGDILSAFFKYSLAFSQFNKHGIYELIFDDNDLYYISNLVKRFAEDHYPLIADHVKFKNPGYLAKCRGKVECLFKRDNSKQRFQEVDEEDLYVFRLGAGAGAKVLIKGNKCPSIEAHVKGGDLGFVIDTRTEEFWDGQELSHLQKYKKWIRNLSFANGH